MSPSHLLGNQDDGLVSGQSKYTVTCINLCERQQGCSQCLLFSIHESPKPIGKHRTIYVLNETCDNFKHTHTLLFHCITIIAEDPHSIISSYNLQNHLIPCRVLRYYTAAKTSGYCGKGEKSIAEFNPTKKIIQVV